MPASRRQSLTKLLEEHPLKASERRVLDFLVEQTRTSGDVISLGTREIAAKIGIANDTVKRALDALVRGGFIERRRHHSDKRRWVYNLHPSIAWDGEVLAAS